MRSKGKALRAIFYFSLILFPLPLLADINIRAGDYRWSYQMPLQGEALRLTYSSRSTYSGLFGAGWCSGLDYEVTDTGPFHCGRRIRKPPDDLKKRLQLRGELEGLNNRILRIDNYQFIYDENKLVKISGPLENYQFTYDNYQNLTSVLKDNQSLVAVKYDNLNDRVTGVVDQNCKESIDYKQSAKKRWISYQKNCQGVIQNSKIYEITYALSAKGSKYIKEVQLKTLKRSTRIQYTESGEILNINLTNKEEKS